MIDRSSPTTSTSAVAAEQTMRKPRPRLDPGRLLDAVPVPNQALRIEDDGRGLLLWVPIRRRFWMRPPFAWFFPFRSEKGLALDALGRQVFRACDGQRTTEQIIEDFANSHGIRFHEARLAVLTFLRSLLERNIVAMAFADGTRVVPHSPDQAP
jgi:hypothetical protein